MFLIRQTLAIAARCRTCLAMRSRWRIPDCNRFWNRIACRTAKLSLVPLLFALAMAPSLFGENNASSVNDPLGRTTPQDAIYQFLDACHARQYARAAQYLDLRQMQTGEREKSGPELAQQLEDLLDDTTFEIAALSPSTSPGSEILVMTVLPSADEVESFALPAQSTNTPRGCCPSINSIADFG